MDQQTTGRSAAQPRTALALAIAALAVGGAARAGCPDAASQAPATGAAHYQQAVYHPGAFAAAAFLPTSGGGPAVVGLWKFEMLARSTPTNKNPMPDGTLIDFGTAAWHSDGTELMNSGIRNPADGDFCQGVWEQAEDGTFALNHYALAYSGGNYVGPANIRERVSVDATGNRMSGGFVLTQYLASVTPGHEFDQTTKLVTITGTIRATRVTAH